MKIVHSQRVAMLESRGKRLIDFNATIVLKEVEEEVVEEEKM